MNRTLRNSLLIIVISGTCLPIQADFSFKNFFQSSTKFVQASNEACIKFLEEHPFISTACLIAGLGGIYFCNRAAKNRAPVITAPPTFEEWHKACSQLPYGRKIGAIRENGSVDYSRGRKTSLPTQFFEQALDQFARQTAQAHSDKRRWLLGEYEHTMPSRNLYDLSRPDDAKEFFTQKLVVPENAILMFHGDLHGDVHALLATLAPYIDPKSFKIVNPNMYIVFLGDYVDRGLYGYECIYTLLCLKNANPDRIFLVRGNHETESCSSSYGFTDELQHKNIPDAIKNKIFNWYELLPVALYVGHNGNFIHCSHGCVERNCCSPFNLLKNPDALFERITECETDNGHTITTGNGFMWNDVHVNPDEPTRVSSRGSSNLYELSRHDIHKELNRASSGTAKLRGVFRAHQHSGAMMQRILGRDGCNDDNHGTAKLWTPAQSTENALWNGIVVTFNVCPDTPYGKNYGYDYDTHGILTVAKDFQDWHLEVKRIIP